MKQLYNSLIFPYIHYCLEAWGRTYSFNVNSVYIMQKKAMQRIFNMQYNEYANNYFMELNAQRIFHLLKYKTGLFMYKANKNLLPKNLFVHKYGHVHSGLTGNFQQFGIRMTKNKCVFLWMDQCCGIPWKQLYERKQVCICLSINR